MLRPRSYLRNLMRETVRMSWHPINLYTLTTRNRMMVRRSRTLFQQRWTAKRDMRDYFGSHMKESSFKALLSRQPLRNYVMRGAPRSYSIESSDAFKTNPDFHIMKQLDSKLNFSSDPNARPNVPLPPPEMLVAAAFERRLDIAVFRACFAPCIFIARKMIASGRVNVNGVTCPIGSYLLQDGDIVTVDPAAIVNLNPELLLGPKASKKQQQQEQQQQQQGDDGVDGQGEKIKINNNNNNNSSTDRDRGSRVSELNKARMNGVLKVLGNKKKTMNVAAFEEEKDFYPLPYQRPWMFIPKYLEVDFELCSFVFLREPALRPGVSEIPSPYSSGTHAVAHEFYSSQQSLRGNRWGRRPLARYDVNRMIVAARHSREGNREAEVAALRSESRRRVD